MPTEADQIRRSLDHLADEITAMRAEQPDAEQIRLVMREAVAEGVRDVLADREGLESGMGALMDAASAVGKRRAAESAGSWLLALLKAAAVRGLIFTILGLLIYQWGGWTALLAAWKAFKGAT